MSSQHRTSPIAETSMFDQLIAQLEESSRRFSRLELDALEIEKLILTSAQKQKELFGDSSKSAHKLSTSLNTFDEELNKMKNDVRNVSIVFKELIKKEAVDELDSRIDKWPLEQFITRKKFISLLEKKEE